MADLQDYLNSEYIQRLKSFAKDRTRNYVSVYVEGDDDIAFWTHALNQFGNKIKFQFAISTNKRAVFGEEGTNGKDALLRMENLGSNKIVCVDADLDLIIDNYSAHTQKIRENNYVINTTYYSIENILSSREFYTSLAQLLKIEEPISIYQELLEWVSLTCIDIFFLLLSYSKESSENRAFWFKDFASCLNGISLEDLGDFSKSQSYKDKWSVKYKSLLNAKQAEISIIHKDLNNAGYTDNQFYALMRGHDLYDCIIKPWIENKINQVINGKIEAFKSTHQGVEIQEYRDSLFKELGTHKGVKEAVDFHFYNNKPLPLALPIQTATKISTLFS